MRQERRWGLSRTRFSRFARCARAPVAVGAIVSTVAGCNNIAAIEVGLCGNGVVETQAHEDCDCLNDATNSETDPTVPYDPNKTKALLECSAKFAVGQKYCARATEAHACRYLCETAAECPPGFGCGADGVCRQPKREFEVLGGAVDVEAERIEVGDFDGDGRQDLFAIASSTASVAFSDPMGSLSGVLSFATNGVRPALGKLTDARTADLTDDLVLGIGIGTNVFQGRPGRTFSSTTYETREIVEVINGQLNSQLGATMLLTTVASAQIPGPLNGRDVPAFAVAVVQGGSGGMPIVGSVARIVLGTPLDMSFTSGSTSPEPLAGPPKLPLPSGDVDGDKLPDVVIAPLAGNQVRVIAPFVGSAAPTQLSVVTLRTDAALGGTYVGGLAFLHDIDGDSDLDLLVTATCPTKTAPDLMSVERSPCFELQVSHNAGGGTFAANAVRVTELSPPPPPPPMPGPSLAPLYRPLAVGDLNEDQIVDIVDSFGISVGEGTAQKPPNSFTKVLENMNAPFSAAVVTDANLDGHLDVFGGSDLSLDITFLAGTGTGVFGKTTLATRGPVSLLTGGDFDGDSVPDLAFAEWSGLVAGVGDHLLSVSFGRAFGFPEEPKRMSAFENIVAISNVEFGVGDIDAAKDLQVAFSRKDKNQVPRISIGAAVGSSTRQLQCSYNDIDKPKESGTPFSLRLPSKFFVGQFYTEDDADADHNDVVFVGTGFPKMESEITLLRSSLVGDLDWVASASLEGLSLAPEDEQFVDGVVINLDGGPDELLLAGRSISGESKSGALAIIGASNTAGAKEFKKVGLMNDAKTHFYKHFRVVDLDGENGDDVLAIGYELEGMMGGGMMGNAAGLRSWVSVMLNDGTPNLCWAPAGSACGVVEQDLDAAVLDVDASDIDGDGTKEILAVTESGVRVLHWNKATAALDLEADLLPLPIQEGWSALRRCDVNGDGVDDLALTSEGRMYVFGGVPVSR